MGYQGLPTGYDLVFRVEAVPEPSGIFSILAGIGTLSGLMRSGHEIKICRFMLLCVVPTNLCRALCKRILRAERTTLRKRRIRMMRKQGSSSSFSAFLPCSEAKSPRL